MIPRKGLPLLVGAAMMATLVAPSHAYDRPGKTERISVSSLGRQSEEVGPLTPATGKCSDGGFDITPSGRHVAFASPQTDLVPDDTNLACDVFVRDRVKGTTERVSVASDGTQGTGAAAGLCGSPSVDTADSGQPSISRDGRYVAFTSFAVNLVPGDTNLASDIFVHDRRSRETRLVSVDSQGNRPPRSLNSCSRLFDKPSISLNGQNVAFQSWADLDQSGDGQGIFVREMKLGKTTRVPESMGVFSWQAPSLSATGRFVLYAGRCQVGTCGAGIRGAGAFVLDRKTGRVDDVDLGIDGTRVDPGALSTPYPNLPVHGRQISADGRFVTFGSDSNSLVPNDTNKYAAPFTPFNRQDVFVHDRKTGRTERVSVSSSGEQSVPGAEVPTLSSDGRFVSFTSSDAVAFGQGGRDTDAYSDGISEFGDSDVFVYDRLTGAVEWISVSPNGEESGGCPHSMQAAISDGKFVAFYSCADDLVEGDTNDLWDYFVRDRGFPVGARLGGDRPAERPPGGDEICIDPEICIPPGAVVASSDATDDLDELMTKQGANLYGASFAYRPQYEDVFAAIELEHMPQVVPGVSPIFYGLRFEVDDKSYEVRASSLLGGTFGLFDCSGSPTCTKVTDLQGGYGTTGMRVVFSLPLEEIGLSDGGRLKDIEAFSAIGTMGTGAHKILDIIRFGWP